MSFVVTMPEAILGSQGFTILNRLTFAKMLRLVTSINASVVINLIVLPLLSYYYCLIVAGTENVVRKPSSKVCDGMKLDIM